MTSDFGRVGADAVSHDFGSPFTFWMGPPNQMSRLDIDVNGSSTTNMDTLPRAHWGKSKVLEEIFEYRITKKDAFYTSELLPWKKTDNIHILASKWNFNKMWVDLVPETSTSRFVEHSSSAVRDSMLRRGMAFILEHGFMKTELGKKVYEMNVKMIEESCTLTVYHLIITALLKAYSRNPNFESYSRTPINTVDDVLKKVQYSWAVMNKGPTFVRQLLANVKENMILRGVHPTVVVFPPKSRTMLGTMHPSEYEYNSAGPNAVRTRKIAGDAYNDIFGMKVYETDVFSEIVCNENYNPLSRIRETGSIFQVKNFYGGQYLDSYTSDTRFATKIPDASNGGIEKKVTGLELLKPSLRFDSDGNLSKVHSQLCKKNIQDELRKRLEGLETTPTEELDMFIGYDPTRDPNNPYYVMKYFGEMRHNDVTDEQIRDFTKTCMNHVKFNAEEFALLDDVERFCNQLNDVDFDKDDHQYYFKAVVASGTIQNAENYSVSNGLMKGNSDGCINPPIIKADGIYYKTTNGDVKIPALRNGHNINGITILPLGYGSCPGLKTLDTLYKKKEYRGYDEEILRTASKHWNVISKLFPIFDSIFPSHELTTSNSCPAWFSSKDTKLDRIYAFFSNFAGRYRSPVVAVPNDKTTSDAETELKKKLEGAVKIEENADSGVFGNYLKQAVINQKTTDSNVVVTVNAVLKNFLINLSDQRLRDALLDSSNYNTITKNYRKHFFVLGKETFSSAQKFLLHIILSGSDSTSESNNKKVHDKLARALNVLLSDNYSTVDWNDILNSENEGVRLGRFKPFSRGVVKPQNGDIKGVIHLNTRLCINDESFKKIAQRAEYDSDLITVGKLYDNIPVRPINVFRPSLGLATVDEEGNMPDDDQNKKDLLLELRFTSEPVGTNSAHSLSNSQFLKSHFNVTNITGAKRTNDMSSDVHTTSGPLGNKRRLVGSDWSDIFSGVPNSHSTYLSYSGDEDKYQRDDDPDSSFTIPSYEEASKIFTFDSVYHQVNGVNYKNDYYRSALVERFHEWAKDTNKFERIWAQGLLTYRISYKAFENFWKKNVLMLIGFEICRPRQRYNMGSIIVAQGGDDLGNAYHGFHDFQWADDVSKKIHIGNYTFMFTATVVGTDRLTVCEDVIAMGDIKGGENVTFCQNVDDVRRLLEDVSIDGKSIIVKMVPCNTDRLKSPQDVAGIWNKSITSQCSNISDTIGNPIHGNSCFYYNRLLGLDRINEETYDMQYEFHGKSRLVNTVLYQGHQSIFDPSPNARNWSMRIEDDGNFGRSFYTGYIKDRDIIGRPINEITVEPKYIFS